MVPKRLPIGLLCKLRNADPVFVRGDVLGPDVHGDFAEVEVGPDAGCGGDACGAEHIQNHLHGQLPGRQTVGFQIVGHVQKHLVNGVDVDVFRGNVFEIHLVNAGAGLHIQGHLRRSHNVVKGELRVGFQSVFIPGTAGKFSAGSFGPSQGVDLPHLLHHFEEPRPAGNAVAFEGRGHSQTDGLFRPARIRHHKMGGQRVQPPLDALHRGIEGF